MENTIGSRIKDLRHKKGLPQVDLAKLIGVSKQTLYKYENDIITNIPSDKIEAIAHILDTTPSHLMGWNNKEITGVGKVLKQLIHNNEDELVLLSLNANIPLELLKDIINENYASISPDLLSKIADYYNVGISHLLIYNTCPLSKEFTEYMHNHDLASIDSDSKLAAFLLTVGYEVYPDAHADNKNYTITEIESGKTLELSSEEFALFKRLLKRNVISSIEAIQDIIDG